ncbi:MAG: DMT family transporter [Patescibacteria group bacterium]
MIKKRYYLLPLFAAFLAGVLYNVVEILMNNYSFNSTFIVIITNFFAGLILFLSIKNKKNIKPLFNKKKNFVLLLVASITTFSLAYFTLYWSIKLIGSAKTSFMVLIEPLFVSILAIIFLKETIKRKDIFWGALLIFGALLINFDFTYFKFLFGWGELLAILAPLLFAIGIVATTDLLKRIPLLEITAIELIIGSILLFLTLGFFISFNFSFALIPIGLLLLTILVIAINWLSYNAGLKYLGASLTSILYSSKAFFTLGISLILLLILPGIGLKIPENIIAMILGGLLMILAIIAIQKNDLKESI